VAGRPRRAGGDLRRLARRLHRRHRRAQPPLLRRGAAQLRGDRGLVPRSGRVRRLAASDLQRARAVNVAPFDLAAELARFRADLPIEAASTPPSSWYTHAEVLALELDTVFRRSWQYACPRDRVALPGSYVRVDV